MVFDWSLFETGIDGKEVVVHCKTFEEALDFCRQSHEHGHDWCTGKTRKDNTCWEKYKQFTCYRMNSFGSLDYYKGEGCKILEWSDYMNKGIFTKSDLQDGDFVLRRNGMVELVLASKGVLVGKHHGSYWNCIDGFNIDFTSFVHKNRDVIAVRRPTKENHFNFEIFKNEDGELLYDEERDSKVTEMTLEEVCKALGKNIKIVKK